MIKKELTKEEIQKTQTDLAFLRKLIEFAKKESFRLVVAGGYGIDGVLGEITRYHNDLDIVLYGNLNRESAISRISEFVKLVIPIAMVNIKHGLFNVLININAEGFGGEIYYVQTFANPFDNINKIILCDGKNQQNSLARFPLPVKSKLLDIEFEAENPDLRLADILYKRRKEDNLEKHKQDIKNLELVTDKDKVELILSKYDQF